MTEDHLRQYREQSQALLDHLYAFNAANDWRHEDVAKIVCRVAQYMAEVPLEDVIESLQDHPMNQNAKYRLHSCLSKVARYRQSAFFLGRMAKKISILTHVTVDHVRLEQAAFQRPSQTSGPSSLGTVLTAIPHRRGVLNLNALPSWAAKSQHQFTTSVRKVLRESKIHAEVQIVVHYEVAGTQVVLPRVIASSKDACYLCHAFISLHGQYSVPASHGKLYTGWRLPSTQHLQALECKMHDFLEQGIQRNVRRFAGVMNKPPMTLPNESTLFPLSVSSSTLSNLSCLDLLSQTQHSGSAAQALPTVLEDERDAKTNEGQQCHQLHRDYSSCVLHKLEDSRDDATSSCSETKTGGETSRNSMYDRTNGFVDEVEQQEKSQTTTSIEREVFPDSSIATEPQRCDDDALPEPIVFERGRFCHENIEIFIEDSTLGTSLRWLSPAGSAEVLRDKAGVVVNVLSLAAGTDTSFLRKDPEGVSYFAFGKQVVMIETGES